MKTLMLLLIISFFAITGCTTGSVADSRANPAMTQSNPLTNTQPAPSPDNQANTPQTANTIVVKENSTNYTDIRSADDDFNGIYDALDRI